MPTERDRSAPPTDRRVSGIHHVGITVRKLEESLAFYRDLLGAEVIKLSSDVDVALVVGLPEARARIADLDAGNGQVVELVEYAPKEAAADTLGGPPKSSWQVSSAAPHRPDTIGTCHVCLQVADLESALARLEHAGVAPLGQAVELHDGGVWQDCTVVYVRDPDGVIVELLERGRNG